MTQSEAPRKKTLFTEWTGSPRWAISSRAGRCSSRRRRGSSSFEVGVVADVGNIVGVEEGAVVSELGEFVAVAEAAGLVAHVAGESDGFAGRQGLVESVDRVHVARRGADQVERAVELEIRDRLFLIGDVDLGDRLAGLVLQSHAHAAVERAAVGIDVDGGVDCRDLGLKQIFVLLELAFVVGLDVAARLGVEILVEDVSVVEVPGAGADGDDGEEQGGRGEPRSALQGQADAGAQGILCSAPGEGDGDDAQHGADRQPVSDRPEQRRDEVAVAVHVGVGVGGSLADEVERVLPAEAVEDGHQDEETDQDGVAHELVRDHGLDEECEKGEGEDLREGHDVEFLEVLQELVVVVTGDGLHHDADQHGEGEEDELDDDDGGEAREPVGGLAHGQRVVDAVEMGVALAPEQFRGIESRRR